MAKKNINAEAIKNSIVDDAFVADMTDRQQEMTQTQKLHNEAGDAVEKTAAWFSDMEISIPVGYAENPKNGVHRVEVVDVEIKKAGARMVLRDVTYHNEWETFVTEARMKETVQSAVYYNKDMYKALMKVGTITPESFFGVLKTKVIKVWTQERDENNTVLTYFNEAKYQKCAMAIAYNRTNSK